MPQTGDVGMGVSIFSYAGQVQFGLITDAALTPDPEAMVGRFPEEFEKYLYYVLLDLPPVAQEEKSTPSHRPPPEVDRGKARGSHREAVTRARTRLAPHAFSRATVSRRERLETRR